MDEMDVLPDEHTLAEMQRAYAQMMATPRQNAPIRKMPIYATPQANAYLNDLHAFDRALRALPAGTWQATHARTLQEIAANKAALFREVARVGDFKPFEAGPPAPPMPLRQSLQRLLHTQNVCLCHASQLHRLCPGCMQECLLLEMLCSGLLAGILL